MMKTVDNNKVKNSQAPQVEKAGKRTFDEVLKIVENIEKKIDKIKESKISTPSIA